MPKFRTKPSEIEAIQFTGDNVDQVCQWAEQNQVSKFISIILEAFDKPVIDCKSLQGNVMARPTNWLIIGNGEVYPCDAAHFASKYEAIDPTGFNYA